MSAMLHHAALEIRPADVEAELAFWRILGFERVDPPPALADRAAWAEREGTQVHLFYADEPVVPPRGHAAVVVDDFERTFAALAPYSPERRTAHWGAARAVATSPTGHRVEFMAAPPA